MSEPPEPTVEEDDRQLMAGIARRDESAFQQLFHRYKARVYSLCLRITGQDHDAADVTSEVFWELWQKPERYCPSKSSPYTYIVMLTRCRAIDRKRQLSRKSTLAILDWMAEGPSTGSPQSVAPDEELALADDRQLVQQAIDRLDPKHREAIELAFFDGLTHQASAAKIGVPLGTIKGRIRRALEQIRQHLEVQLRD
jgi:RNA polymerase sigma-70 factor, ECF subfamily